MSPRDPIAPQRRRPRRLAKKLAKRDGMLRCRGWSIERIARAMAPMNEIVRDNTLSRLFHEHFMPMLNAGLRAGLRAGLA